MQITSPCKGFITQLLSKPIPEVTTLKAYGPKRRGKKCNQGLIYNNKKKDGTTEGNAILQVQALKKQIMINPFFGKVSFLSLIPQFKLYGMPPSSNS